MKKSDLAVQFKFGVGEKVWVVLENRICSCCGHVVKDRDLVEVCQGVVEGCIWRGDRKEPGFRDAYEIGIAGSSHRDFEAVVLDSSDIFRTERGAEGLVDRIIRSEAHFWAKGGDEVESTAYIEWTTRRLRLKLKEIRGRSVGGRSRVSVTKDVR